MRLIGAITLAAAMALGTTAVWAGGSSDLKILKLSANYSKKLCIADNTRSRKQVTWVCQADQLCCYDRLFDRKSCQPKSRRFCW